MRRIAKHFSPPLTKLFLKFLNDALALFDSVNKRVQASSIGTVHRYENELHCLLKQVLRSFVLPADIRKKSNDLTKVACADESYRVPADDLYVDDEASATLIHLEENEDDEDIARTFQQHVLSS